MNQSPSAVRRIGVSLAVVAIVLSACKASTTGSSAGPSAVAPGSAGTVNLAVNPWVGYEADAAVVSYILTNQLGYTVNKKDIVEQVSWQGFETGDVDAILENWGHDDLKATYITQKKVAVEVGSTGRQGIIGWFVPQWMADKYPDITDYKNLNKYADLFKTSESGGKGQLLDGDPSYVTNDVALVQNLGLNFKVVQGGSEATLITQFQSAQTNQTPLLAYFYSPQWALHDLKLAHVLLPPYTAGCDADPKKVACDYPPYDLDKIASARFATANSTAYQFIKNFQWTNDDQNVVAGYIARDGMTDDAAAKKWIDANPTKVAAWLPK
jgi:glycine betaine/proline transport system substrate-binding protein